MVSVVRIESGEINDGRAANEGKKDVVEMH